MNDDLLFALTGKYFNKKPLIIHWFKRFAAKWKSYPAVIKYTDSNVEGYLTQIDDKSLNILDFFEWDEYKRADDKTWHYNNSKTWAT